MRAQLRHHFAIGVFACAVLGCQKQTQRCDTSNSCQEHQSCIKGRCLDRCVATAECLSAGRCTTRAGKCVVGGDADCRRADSCNGSAGLCTVKNGVCVAQNDADCRAARMCETLGRCHFADGACVAQEEQACVDSAACGDERLSSGLRSCQLNATLQRCVSCEETKGCSEEGRCGLQLRTSMASCVQCDQSDLCLKGYCRLLQGRCVNQQGIPFSSPLALADVSDPRRLNEMGGRDSHTGPTDPEPIKHEGHRPPKESLVPPGTVNAKVDRNAHAETDVSNKKKAVSTETSENEDTGKRTVGNLAKTQGRDAAAKDENSKQPPPSEAEQKGGGQKQTKQDDHHHHNETNRPAAGAGPPGTAPY